MELCSGVCVCWIVCHWSSLSYVALPHSCLYFSSWKSWWKGSDKEKGQTLKRHYCYTSVATVALHGSVQTYKDLWHYDSKGILNVCVLSGCRVKPFILVVSVHTVESESSSENTSALFFQFSGQNVSLTWGKKSICNIYMRFLVRCFALLTVCTQVCQNRMIHF